MLLPLDFSLSLVHYVLKKTKGKTPNISLAPEFLLLWSLQPTQEELLKED